MNFFLKLLKPNSDTSSRRLIALSMLPLLYLGCVIMIYSGNPTLMIVGVTIPFLIVMLAFFALKWADAKDILGTMTNIKRTDSTIIEKTEEITPTQ